MVASRRNRSGFAIVSFCAERSSSGVMWFSLADGGVAERQERGYLAASLSSAPSLSSEPGTTE